MHMRKALLLASTPDHQCWVLLQDPGTAEPQLLQQLQILYMAEQALRPG